MSRGKNRSGALQGTLLVLGLALMLGALPSLAEERLFYFVRGREIVFTNTPSRSDMRAVPGLEPTFEISAIDLPATPYDPYIEQVARQTGLSPSLIKAVALVESGLDPEAVSPKGAMGLMQLMPGTAKQYGVRNAFDPGENLLAGAKHLRHLLDEFGGDLTLTLAAYNAGSGAVRRHGGVPAYRETRDYVRRVHEKLGKSPRDGGKPTELRAPVSQVKLVREENGTILLVN